MRKFVDEVLTPEAQVRIVSSLPSLVIDLYMKQERELNGKNPSQAVFDAMAEKNVIAMRLGPGKHLKGRTLLDGAVKPEEVLLPLIQVIALTHPIQFDYFYELITHQEFTRIGARGYGDGLLSGAVIGLPPVLNFGSEELKARIVPEVLGGKKFISLAISEAFAGSDVAGLQTVAKKSEDGKFWFVTGTKKYLSFLPASCSVINDGMNLGG